MAYFEATVIRAFNTVEIIAFDLSQSCYSIASIIQSNNATDFTTQSLNDELDLISACGLAFQDVSITDLGDGTYRYYMRTPDLPDGFILADQTKWSIFPVFMVMTFFDGISSFIFQYVSNNPEDLTICDECRNITLQACAESYKIVAGLTPATNYFVTIQDRNNDLYIQEITSDGNGDVTIDATSPEFPAGFWLTESGNKVIKIYSDEALTEIQDITVDTTVYSCVLLNLQYYYTTTT